MAEFSFLRRQRHTLVGFRITYGPRGRAVLGRAALNALPFGHVARLVLGALPVRDALDALAAQAAHPPSCGSIHALVVAGASQAEVAVAVGCIIGAAPPVRACRDALERQRLAHLPGVAIERAPTLHALVQREVAARCRPRAVRILDALEAQAGERVAVERGKRASPPRLRRARNGRKPGVLLEVEHLGLATRQRDSDRERDEPPAHGDPASDSASARANPAG